MFFGLDGPRATVLWWTLPAYMTLVGGAVLLATGVLVWRLRHTWRPRHAVDSTLLALAFGLLLARAEHIALNFTYFANNPAEIFSLAAGGLDAHGAVIGAALGGFVAARLYRSPYGIWLGAAAYALPLIAAASWWGCAAAGCAYGAEVENLSLYPRWLVWEAPGDFLAVAPRYAVQPLGVWLSLAVLLAVAAAEWHGVGGRRLAGIALAGIMASSFALGFLRGDSGITMAGLRAGQWLDIAGAAAGVALLVPRRRLHACLP